jgi:26S proteasome regulatory subunit T1
MAPDLEDDIKDEKNPRLLEEDDIALLKTYVSSPRPDFFPSLLFSSI